MKHIILIIFLTLGIWAEEVGVPYVDAREAVAQSAALSPDGETFYTYANNTLTHWSLNPMKALESVKIEDADIVNDEWHQLFVLANSKKIIFSTRTFIAIYDIAQKKVLKKIKMSRPVTNMIGSDLIVVSKMKILKLDPSTLEMRSSMLIPPPFSYVADDFAYFILDSYNHLTFTLVSLHRFLVINTNSLEIENQYISNNEQCSIDTNLQYIEGEKFFNIAKQQLSNESYGVMREWWPFYIIKSEKDFSLVNFENRNTLTFVNKINNKPIRLYQYHDNNWIIANSNNNFDGSPEARKYLYMKTPSGESVPIDDATYNKFHKQINLKD